MPASIKPDMKYVRTLQAKNAAEGKYTLGGTLPSTYTTDTAMGKTTASRGLETRRAIDENSQLGAYKKPYPIYVRTLQAKNAAEGKYTLETRRAIDENSQVGAYEKGYPEDITLFQYLFVNFNKELLCPCQHINSFSEWKDIMTGNSAAAREGFASMNAIMFWLDIVANLLGLILHLLTDKALSIFGLSWGGALTGFMTSFLISYGVAWYMYFTVLICGGSCCCFGQTCVFLKTLTSYFFYFLWNMVLFVLCFASIVFMIPSFLFLAKAAGCCACAFLVWRMMFNDVSSCIKPGLDKLIEQGKEIGEKVTAQVSTAV